MDLREVTQQILQRITESHQAPLNDVERAGFSQSGTATTGLTFYDLEPAAKLLYPVLTPLRNRIPRVSGKGGIQANWKAITAINTLNMRGLVSEGQRGGAITHTLTEYLAAYRGIGLENYVTFEAELAAMGFDNAKALAVQVLLQSVMLEEENLILGGNTSTDLGQPSTPSCTDVLTGGELAANTTYKVYCVPLTAEGYWNNTVAGGLASTITKTNTDGTTDTYNGGVGLKSGQGTVTTANDSNATHGIRATVTPVKGAMAYAWYWGANGSELLGAITTINSVEILAAATGTQNASEISSTTDHSKNALAFDGLYYNCFKASSGAYYAALATGTAGTGTALASDGAGGITQIEAAFQSFWDNYRLSPDIMFVSATELLKITKLVLANGGAPLIRFNFDVGSNATAIDAGVVIGSYLNKITNKKVQIIVHPKAIPGTILFYSDGVPYPLAGIQNILQIRARRDYYQIEWPLKSRKYEFGVYADEVLQNYFPPAFGVLCNIGG